MPAQKQPLQKRNLLSTYWIPNQIWYNRDIDYKLFKKSRVLVSFLMIGLFTFSIYGSVNLARGYYLSSALSFFIFFSFLALLISFKLKQTYRLSSCGMILSLLVILFFHQLRSEPFLISHTVWVPIFPLLGAMMIGVRGAIWVSFFTLITFLGAPLLVEFYEPLEIVRKNDLSLNIIAIFLSLAVSFFMVYHYDKSKWEVFGLLERKNEELEKISEDNRLLTAIVTHDLSNPLTTMGIYMSKIEQMVKADLGEDHPTTLAVMQKSSQFHKSFQASCELVHHVKNTLAMQMKKIDMSLTVTDLFDALKKVVVDYEHMAQAKKIKININRLREGVYECLAEPISLKASVLSNLISNAIKFSKEGSVIDINLNKDGDYVFLDVRDYGVGIDPERISRIFEMKTSLSTQGTSGEKGTGYGLPIVKAYVDRFHGEIEVISMNSDVKKEQGTLVRLRLPKAA